MSIGRSTVRVTVERAGASLDLLGQSRKQMAGSPGHRKTARSRRMSQHEIADTSTTGGARSCSRGGEAALAGQEEGHGEKELRRRVSPSRVCARPNL